MHAALVPQSAAGWHSGPAAHPRSPCAPDAFESNTPVCFGPMVGRALAQNTDGRAHGRGPPCGGLHAVQACTAQRPPSSMRAVPPTCSQTEVDVRLKLESSRRRPATWFPEDAGGRRIGRLPPRGGECPLPPPAAGLLDTPPGQAAGSVWCLQTARACRGALPALGRGLWGGPADSPAQIGA